MIKIFRKVKSKFKATKFQKFLSRKKIIFGCIIIFIAAGFAFHFIKNGKLAVFGGSNAAKPELYAAVYRAPFQEGMVVPASCESGYEHLSGECGPLYCNVSFSPSTVRFGYVTSLNWDFSLSTVSYSFNCTGNLGSRSGIVPPDPYIGSFYGVGANSSQSCAMTVKNSSGASASCMANIIVNPLAPNPEVSCPAGQTFVDALSLGTPQWGGNPMLGMSDPVMDVLSDGTLMIMLQAPFGYNSYGSIWEKNLTVSGNSFAIKDDWFNTLNGQFTYDVKSRPKLMKKDSTVSSSMAYVAGNKGLLSGSFNASYDYPQYGNWFFNRMINSSNFGSSGPSSASGSSGTYKVVGTNPVMLQKCVPLVTLSVNKTGLGSGNVNWSGSDGSVNSGFGQMTYAQGTVVTLTATPADSNSTFTGWSGGVCSGTGNCVVTMNAAKSVMATFDPVTCAAGCGACDKPCGGGTQSCVRADCSGYSQSCNTNTCPSSTDSNWKEVAP